MVDVTLKHLLKRIQRHVLLLEWLPRGLSELEFFVALVVRSQIPRRPERRVFYNPVSLARGAREREDLPSNTSRIFPFCRGLVGGVGPATPADMLVSAAVGLKVGASGLNETDLREAFGCFCFCSMLCLCYRNISKGERLI